MLIKRLFRGKKVAVVGVGAIGCIAAAQLVREGMTNITIIDRDFVDSTNLDRQLLYSVEDAGMPKAIAAKKRLGNPGIKAVVADIDKDTVKLLSGHDIVLDCTDNFETRFLINDYCRANRIPWIYAAAVRDIATVYVILPESACFRCIFDRHAAIETCDTAGVELGAVSLAAGLQADQAVKILLGRPYEKDMVRINFAAGRIFTLKAKKRNDCAACLGNYEYLSGKKGSRLVRLCGTNSYQIKGRKANLAQLQKRLAKAGISSERFGSCVHFKNLVVFSDGRAMIKAESPEKARSLYSKFVGN